MSLYEIFKMALRNISGSKGRTALTMLGIVIGVAAVILIVGLGNGMSLYMEDQFAALGTNTISVVVTGRGTSRTVSEEEMYELFDDRRDLFSNMSPTVTMQSTLKIGTESVSTTSITGVSESYFTLKDFEIEQGRGLQYVDIAARRHVCVIGSYLNDTYYNGRGLGDVIKIGNNSFTIVGIMAQEDDEPDEGGTDDCLYLPYSTAARMSYSGRISTYTYEIVDEDNVNACKKAIEDHLYEIFEDKDAYTVISMSEILDMLNSVVGILVGVLAFIAGISLVVGGIGIMNIMLVSVTERTREIGIRKALGAKESTVMTQFVIEAAITSALGGVVGILIGYLFSAIATPVASALIGEKFTVVPSVGSVFLAFGISAGIGILFGYLPARKAARLNPIDALRYE